ncbi:MAG: hypothetical protein WBD25_10350 [Terriglobales bacterium]
MKRDCKINKTVLVMMILAAVAIAFKAPAAWAQGYLRWSGVRPQFRLTRVKHRRWQFPVNSQ